MQRALQELERQGLLFSQRTSGRFVTEDTEMIEDAKRTLANRHITAFIRQMQALGYTRQEIVALLEESEREKNMTPILECRDLCKSYGRTQALEHVNLTVEPGKLWVCWDPTAAVKPR